jgi:hypothetical protein
MDRKGGHANLLSAIRKSANSWAQSATANPEISEVCQSATQIRKFVMINPQITNPQIFLVSQTAKRKSANLQGKKSVFLIQIRIGLPLIFFFYLRKYILVTSQPS